MKAEKKFVMSLAYKYNELRIFLLWIFFFFVLKRKTLEPQVWAFSD